MRLVDSAERFWAKVERRGPSECWPWRAYISEWGYGRFGYAGKVRFAHRIAYELKHGPIPKGLFVCHSCDVKACCNPDHLFVGTHQDNMQDAKSKGRFANGSRSGWRTHPEAYSKRIWPKRPGTGLRGERNHRAKLTRAQVEEIRGHLSKGERQTNLARQYRIAQSVISGIARGRLWA